MERELVRQRWRHLSNEWKEKRENEVAADATLSADVESVLAAAAAACAAAAVFAMS
jgi:hypothetical protein